VHGASSNIWPVRKRFARVLRLAEVGGHRVYDLRHSYASGLLAKNAPITYVAAQLGHADATTTLRWYARWLPKSGVSFVDALDTGSTWHQVGTNAPNAAGDAETPEENTAETLKNSGGPFRARTGDPLIKSESPGDHHRSRRNNTRAKRGSLLESRSLLIGPVRS
jgi:hypothetical protein